MIRPFIADPDQVNKAKEGRGDEIRAGKLSMACLHPQRGGTYADANEYSMAFLLQYGGFMAFLGGDLEKEGEAQMLSACGKWIPEQGVTLLKASHHGSREAMQPPFLNWMKPRYAVISAGKDNRYGHPHEETMEALAEAGLTGERRPLVTAEEGCVRVLTDGRKMRILSFLNP